MHQIDVRFRTLDKVARATLGEVSGVIDTSTLEEFREAIDEALRSGVIRLVLDLGQVKFVNSSGLGVLVKANDSLREMGGGIALIRVPAKIRLVIEMLGLDTYFTLRENEEEALLTLGASVEGSTRAGRLWAAPAAITTCGSCGLLISIPEPGSYRCPRCFAGVICSEDGEATFWVPDQPAPTIVAFPCSPEASEGIVGLVQGHLKKMSYSQARIREIEGALREISRVLREEVHDDGTSGICHLKLETQPMAVEVEISDGGRTLSQDEATTLFRRVRETADEFSCKPHPLGGNIIRFSKRK